MICRLEKYECQTKIQKELVGVTRKIHKLNIELTGECTCKSVRHDTKLTTLPGNMLSLLKFILIDSKIIVYFLVHSF